MPRAVFCSILCPGIPLPIGPFVPLNGIAVGPQHGRKVFTLQTLPESDPYESSFATVGNVAGFSLHARVAAKAQQRDKISLPVCSR